MPQQNITVQAQDALETGRGVLRLSPTWVPRSFLMPGKRIRLAEQDLYVLGTKRGGIDERWFASTTKADNGPDTPEDEGLSYVVGQDGNLFLLRDAVEVLGSQLIGQRLMDDWGRWPLYCKYFDNMGPIPFHLHQLGEHARLVGREPKAEAYYFPRQLNPLHNNFPYTFFGLEPGTTKEDIYGCLERWHDGDNGILNFSKAYRLEPGTGWLVPPGILHAPGSLCTYEVQWGSDVFAMYQSMVEGRIVDWDLLVKDVPEHQIQDFDYIVGMIDWESNLNPNFKQDHFLEPMPIADTVDEGYQDVWVIYGEVNGQDLFAAKELTVLPGDTAILQDNGASGAIVVQGHGMLGPYNAEASTFVRYGELTRDEYFISAEAAREGVPVQNAGQEPMVILRYLGPGSIADMISS